MKWKVVADEQWAELAREIDAHARIGSDDRTWDEALEAVCDSHPELLVVVGDDGTVSRVATHLYEQRRGDAVVPLLLSLPKGSVTPVSEGVGTTTSTAKLRRHLGAAKFGVRTRSSLRVVDMSRPGSRLAFNIGLGLPFEFFDARARSARAGRLGLVEAFASVAREEIADAELLEADVFVDWEPRAEHFRYLLASAGEGGWFGIEMPHGDGPTFRLGRSALELFESRSRVGRIVQRATGRGAEPFERIHIDTNSGYVLDGELFDPGVPRTIAVHGGPSVRFATI